MKPKGISNQTGSQAKSRQYKQGKNPTFRSFNHKTMHLILKAFKVKVKHLAGYKTPVPCCQSKALTGIARTRLRDEVCAMLLWLRKAKDQREQSGL